MALLDGPYAGAIKAGIVVVGIGMLAGAYFKITDAAYERGYAAADLKARILIEQQAARARQIVDELRTQPDAVIDCRLLQLTKPETVCP